MGPAQRPDQRRIGPEGDRRQRGCATVRGTYAARWCGAICVRPGVDFRALNAVAGVAVVPAGLPVCFPVVDSPDCGCTCARRWDASLRPFQVKPQVALPLTTE